VERDVDDRNIESARHIEEMLSTLPEVSAAYDDHVKRRGVRYKDAAYEPYMVYLCVNEVLWLHLEALLSSAGPDDALRRACSFVERLASSTAYARSVVATELGWELWARRHARSSAELAQVAERYMGPTTAAVFASQRTLALAALENARWPNRIRRWLHLGKRK